MATRYSIVGSRRARLLNTNINTNTEIKAFNSFEEENAALQSAKKFVPVYDEQLTAFYRKATSVDLIIWDNEDGSEENRVIVTMPNGDAFNLNRVFDAENEDTYKSLLPEKSFTTEEIKSLEWGYCTRGKGGSLVYDNTKNANTGERGLARRRYLLLNVEH